MRSLKTLFASCLFLTILLITSCKKDDPPTPPIVKTTIISEITQSTATGGGEIEDNGGEPVTKRGICWGTTNSPTISGDKTTDGTGDGSFISRITGLTPGNLYYVRAYATNSVGTGYGKPISFNTNPVALSDITTADVIDITATSAKAGGNIVSAGGGDVTIRGVCWSSINQVPTTADSKTTDGSGIGSYTSSLADLEYNKTYYVRAYAINSAGTAYGLVKSFKTLPVAPTVTTKEVTNRSYNTATGGGDVISDGGSPVTDRGICFATHIDPKVNENNLPAGNGIGSFTVEITGLTPNTTYHVRAYGATAADTSYGADKSFTTLPVTLPQLTTLTFSAITDNSASTGGEITSDGGEAITSRGVCWSLSESPTIDNEKTVNGSGVGSFASTISNLLPATTYYVRAYATTSFGTGYGNQRNFTTNASLATVSTNPITDLGHRSVTTGGNITADGGATITSRGVCWSTGNTPTINDEKTINGAGAGSFTSIITDLTPKTTYFVRAYATNNSGTSYGIALSFTTISTAPSLSTSPISNVSQTTALSGGVITDDGGEPILAKGVCWNISPLPTITNSHVDEGGGTDQYSSTLTSLLGNTTYFVRAYATNIKGTSYGQELSFKTEPTAPKVTTTNVSEITSFSGLVMGNVSSDEGDAVIERGICWSLSENPTINDSHNISGSGLGAFSSTIVGLDGNKTYHVRAYATNNYGTGYGQDLQLITLPNVFDVDGNSYKVVQIGTQFWMAENLKTTKYNDGTPIQYLVNIVNEDPTYCWYNDDIATYKNEYGALYSGYTARVNKTCPAGWRIPLLYDIQTLATFLGGEAIAGGKLKESGFTHWLSPNTEATNSTTFTGLPGGLRGFTGSVGIKSSGYWWTGSLYLGYDYIQYSMRLDNGNGRLNIVDSEQSRTHYSIRCIKN